MKLYATLQSENQSEGMGSNDVIDIYLKHGNKQIGILSLTTETDAKAEDSQYLLRWYPRGWVADRTKSVVVLKEGHETEGVIQELTTGKNKKQIGETGHNYCCRVCKTSAFWTLDDYAESGSPVCVDCGNDMELVRQ